MSAELLRRAAEKLRGHAARATTTERWVAGRNFLEPHEVWIAGNQPVLELACDDAGTGNAEYIALMHPPVALALADLFDKCASTEEEFRRCRGKTSEGGEAASLDRWVEVPLVDVARVVLREDQ